MELKIVNWAALNNYNVGPADMEDEKAFGLNHLARFISTRFDYGILDGAIPSLGAGLAIALTEGLIFFNNGRLAVLDAQNVNFEEADPALDRYDRVEVYFEEDDSRGGFDEGGNALVVTKTVKAKVNVKKGVPGENPVIPTLTASSIGLLIVKVRAATVNLATTDLFTDERYRAESKRVEEYPSHDLGNNTTKSIPEILVDEQTYKRIIVKYEIERATAAEYKHHIGRLTLSYNPLTEAWEQSNPFRGDDCGISFAIGENKTLEVTTDDFAGADYDDKLTILSTEKVRR